MRAHEAGRGRAAAGGGGDESSSSLLPQRAIQKESKPRRPRPPHHAGAVTAEARSRHDPRSRGARRRTRAPDAKLAWRAMPRSRSQRDLSIARCALPSLRSRRDPSLARHATLRSRAPDVAPRSRAPRPRTRRALTRERPRRRLTHSQSRPRGRRHTPPPEQTAAQNRRTRRALRAIQARERRREAPATADTVETAIEQHDAERRWWCSQWRRQRRDHTTMSWQAHAAELAQAARGGRAPSVRLSSTRATR